MLIYILDVDFKYNKNIIRRNIIKHKLSPKNSNTDIF